MNNKGVTLVELIVSFSLTTVIGLFLMYVVLFFKDNYVITTIKNNIVLKQSTIVDRINKTLNSNKIVEINDSCGEYCLQLRYDNNNIEIINFDINSNKIMIGDFTTNLPNGTKFSNVTFNKNEINNKGILAIKADLVNSTITNEEFNINVIYQYTPEVTVNLNS